ncbi:MAG: hypothetical protein DRN99_07200, partial [Thermoproteota archaeon]
MRLIPARRAWALALMVLASSAMASATLASLEGVREAVRGYSAGGVVVTGAEPYISASRVPLAVAELAEGIDGVEAVSPEILAFTVAYTGGGRYPVVVRGVDPRAFMEVEDVEVVEGRFLRPEDCCAVVLGEKAARRLSLHLGGRFLLASSKASEWQVVEVVGVVEGAPHVESEILMSLRGCRWVAAVSPSEVSLIRVKAERGAAARVRDAIAAALRSSSRRRTVRQQAEELARQMVRPERLRVQCSEAAAESLLSEKLGQAIAAAEALIIAVMSAALAGAYSAARSAVLSSRREVGVAAALGGSYRGILARLLYTIAPLAASASIAGCLAGYALCWVAGELKGIEAGPYWVEPELTTLVLGVCCAMPLAASLAGCASGLKSLLNSPVSELLMEVEKPALLERRPVVKLLDEPLYIAAALALVAGAAVRVLPYLKTGVPFHLDSWQHIGAAARLSAGRVSLREGYAYHWPGVNMLIAFTSAVTGVDAFRAALAVPAAASASIAGVYMLARRAAGSRSVAALAAAIAAFSPICCIWTAAAVKEAVAVPLMLVLLSLLPEALESRPGLAAFLLLYAGLLLAHHLTLLIALIAVTYYVLGHLGHSMLGGRGLRRHVLLLALVYGALAGYYLYIPFRPQLSASSALAFSSYAAVGLLMLWLRPKPSLLAALASSALFSAPPILALRVRVYEFAPLMPAEAMPVALAYSVMLGLAGAGSCLIWSLDEAFERRLLLSSWSLSAAVLFAFAVTDGVGGLSYTLAYRSIHSLTYIAAALAAVALLASRRLKLAGVVAAALALLMLPGAIAALSGAYEEVLRGGVYS